MFAQGYTVRGSRPCSSRNSVYAIGKTYKNVQNIENIQNVRNVNITKISKFCIFSTFSTFNVFSVYLCPAMNKFIRQVSAVYLSIIVLLRILAMPISLIDYSVNKNFIASNFCENRLRDNVHCAGHCYLHKQLTKANDNPVSGDQKGTIKTGIVDFFEAFD